jgi:hypothetical protein
VHVVAVTVAVLALAPWSAAGAAGVGRYPTWSVAGGSGAFTGTMTVPAIGFPATTFTSNATGASGVQIETGASVFLPASSPFGAVYGSSQGQPYLNIASAASQSPSDTVFTFGAPAPSSGWGFAVGDIDADTLQVSATGIDGVPVTVDALGFQGTFNHAGASDVPTWDPATGTLVGNGANTSGAAAWFQPRVALRTLSLRFSVLSGFPTYQLWFAATTATISGVVETPPPAGPEPVADAPISLTAPEGDVVATTTSGPDGSFTIPDVVTRPGYELTVDPPPGNTSVVSTTVTVDLSGGDVTGLVVILGAAPSGPGIPAPSPAAPALVNPRFTG